MMLLKGTSTIKIYKVVRFSRAKCNLTVKVFEFQKYNQRKMLSKNRQDMCCERKEVLSDSNKNHFSSFLKDFYVINKDDFLVKLRHGI